MNLREHLSPGTLQTSLFGLAMTCLGYWFGSNATGRLATQPNTTAVQTQRPRLTPVNQTVTQSAPEWVNTAQTLNTAALSVAGVCFLGVLYLDYRQPS